MNELTYSFTSEQWIILMIGLLILLALLLISAVAMAMYKRKRFEEMLTLAAKYNIKLTPMNVLWLRELHMRLGFEETARVLGLAQEEEPQ